MFLLLLLARLCSAETLWAASAAEGVRWPEVTAVSVSLQPGDEVEVLARQGDLVRVRKGVNYGWVQAGTLTDVAPPKPEGVPAEGADLFPGSTGEPVEGTAPADGAAPAEGTAPAEGAAPTTPAAPAGTAPAGAPPAPK